MPKVSVLIPARNERFLVPTVRDVLAKAAGDLEVVVILDGYWPTPPLPDDPRLKILHFGDARGMRPALNAAAQIATGTHLMKLDAHCMVAEGFDVQLLGDYVEDNWIMIPRRYALDPEAWTIDTSNRKYPVDYHYLSYPFERPGDPKCGMHGTAWTDRREARHTLLIDAEMSSQGSCWFMSRRHWDWLGPMEIDKYGNFIQEMQELGLKTWLGGGALMVTKRTWYAHLYKGTRYGRGYTMGGTNHQRGAAFCIDYWMHDRWDAAIHPLRWLIERFAPVPSWPADLDVAFRTARAAQGAVA